MGQDGCSGKYLLMGLTGGVSKQECGGIPWKRANGTNHSPAGVKLRSGRNPVGNPAGQLVGFTGAHDVVLYRDAGLADFPVTESGTASIAAGFVVSAPVSGVFTGVGLFWWAGGGTSWNFVTGFGCFKMSSITNL